MRIPNEVLVFLYRSGHHGTEVLLLHRSPEEGAYWHAVAGALESGESDVKAAIREVREETGLHVQPPLVDLGHRYAYPVHEEPPERRRVLWDENVESVSVESFAAEVPSQWEPQLNQEHDVYRWCRIEEALLLLRWQDARDALQLLARLIREHDCDTQD